MKYYEVRCPGKRKHLKRSKDNLVVEDNCSMLLTFIGEDVSYLNEVRHCTNCKTLTHITMENGIFVLKVLPKGTKLETIDGSYTVDEC